MKLAKVDKHTRACDLGKRIYCPSCGVKKRVYHFSWSAIPCDNCKKWHDKNEWLVANTHDLA